MTTAIKSKIVGALAVSLGLSLGACGGMPNNPTLYSVNEPVVERNSYPFDVRSDESGLSIPEQQRLAEWFEAMDLGYGDRVSIEDPSSSSATREAIAKLASRHGILLSESALVSSDFINAGTARVIITRSTAQVPGCPDWSTTMDSNFRNATSSGYGCATNSNMAAMVADKEDLIAGKKGSGSTVINTSTKAIDSYRKQAPTGEGGLGDVGSSGGN